MRKAKPGVAPDAPSKQLAWTTPHKPAEGSGNSQMNSIGQEMPGHRVYKAEPMTLVDGNQTAEPSPIRPSDQTGPMQYTQDGSGGPATSTPEGGDGGARGFPSRTYHSIKEMISGRLAKGHESSSDSLSPQSQLRQHGVYLAAASSTTVQDGRQQQQQQPRPHPQQQQYQPAAAPDAYQGYQPPRRPQYQQEAAGAIPRYQQQTPISRQVYQQYGPPKHVHPYVQDTPKGPGAYEMQNSYEVHQQQQVYVHKEATAAYEMSVYSAGAGGGQMYTPAPRQQVYHHPHQQQQPQDDKQQQSYQQHPRTPLLQVKQHQQQNYQLHQQPHHQQHHDPHHHHHQQQHLDQQQHQQMQHHEQQQQQHAQVNHQQKGEDPEDRVQEENAANHQQHGHQQQPPQHKTVDEVPRTKQEPKSKDDHDEDDDEGGFVKAGGQTDSGRGSTVYSSGKAKTSPEPVQNNGDSQWVDLVETELRNILRPENNHSTLSESISSVSPPLPPLSPTASSEDLAYKRKSATYNTKGHGSSVWVARSSNKDRNSHHRSHVKQISKSAHNVASSSLEIDSMLDENNSSDEDLEYTDVQTIRKQLEGLENMYSQVLKLLGVNKKSTGRYEASDPRINKRRTHGSVSSLPSSVSSRPIRDKRRDTRNKVRDIKGINKRFQRLESHVVTLARSVAHLSSEMRTQHLMMQEMEVMRGELASLRVQAATRARLATPPAPAAPNSTPEKVKKLTKFFGDEPPLLRLFLKKLGYEKYASLFEKERIGLVELPYMTEERLVRLGVPLGPRLRIMQQAQLAFTQAPNTLCIV